MLFRSAVSLIEGQGGTALFVEAGLGSFADIQRVLHAVESRFGALHVVSNNAAAGTANTPIAEISEPAWDRTMAVTLRAHRHRQNHAHIGDIRVLGPGVAPD